MALKSFNVAKGLSVGAVATDVIDSNANITAAGLAANGAVSFTGSNVSLGDVANLHITGGSSGQILTTDGSGGLSFATPAAGYSNADVESLLSNGTLSEITLANTAQYGWASSSAYITNDGNGIVINTGGGLNGVQLTGSGRFLGTNGQVIAITGQDSWDIAQKLKVGTVVANSGLTLTSNVAAETGITIYPGTTSNYSLVLPSTAGTNGQALMTNGTGTLSWGDVAVDNVANANYANFAGTAYSVDGANVSGSVAVADEAYSIDGANVSGTVANATYATTAGSAYSVSGANVSGEVANATYATYAGTAYSVSGGNVSGEVANAGFATYAGTAYSVDGANVNGTVANATFATSAGSVSGADVTGTVAYANYANFAGEATTATGLNADITDIVITGGTTGYVLTTDGAGNVSWSNIANDDANYANFAGEAFSVAAANIVGEVANANYASYAGTAANANVALEAYSVDGSNVSGQVAYAGTAYSVDGANVVGTVSTASTAYSVDGANVTGTVSYAQTAYGVDGGNVFGTVGNATNAMYSDTANTAAYVSQSDQSNITSVGTLANLTTNGFANIGGTLTVTTGGANITGDVGVNGNLTVTGNLVYLDVQNTTVSDPLFVVGANNSADLVDLGLVAEYDDGSSTRYTGLARDHNDGKWKLFDNSVAPTTTVDDFTQLASLEVGSITTGSANVDSLTVTTGDLEVNSGNVSGQYLKASNGVDIDLSMIRHAHQATNSTSPTQVWTTGALSGQARAFEFLIRGSDTVASKHTTAKAIAMADASGNVDYQVYGHIDLNGGAGTFVIQDDGSAGVELRVTSNSSNATLWTTTINFL